MNDLLYLFGISAGLAALLASITIWSPRKVRVKVVAITMFTLFVPTAYMSLADLLSRPKPANMEWEQRQLSEATVLGSHLREGHSIYLWLQVAGVEEPRSYVLPWSQELAEQLHGARREAESQGTAVRMRRPFLAEEDESDPVFYAPPQPMPPEKQAPSSTPLSYQHSTNS
jgi:hypothetical protein